jgi:hypothetical protein
MNSQIVKGFWKIAEDYPTTDKDYLVAFPANDGTFSMVDCDVWEFRSGEWLSLPDSRFQEQEVGLPTYYIDLPMPR